MKKENIIRLLIAIVAVLIFSIIVYILPSFTGKEISNTDNPNKEEQVLNKNEQIIYKPEARKLKINGKTKAIIELGASGFNYFIVKIDKEKNWELLKPEFGVSLAKEGIISKKEVVSTLRSYISEIASYGVTNPRKDIHFVVSSGALKNKDVQKIIEGVKEMEYTVNEVTANKEAECGFLACVPKKVIRNSFFVDIGSGNTKIAWSEGNNIITRETVGSKYYQDNIDNYQVHDEISQIVNQIPLGNRENCIIIGGIPFKIAKQQRDENEKFTKLDLVNFKSIEAKEKSGKIILRAIEQEANCDNFIFDWDANFSIGFLVFKIKY